MSYLTREATNNFIMEETCDINIKKRKGDVKRNDYNSNVTNKEYECNNEKNCYIISRKVKAKVYEAK